MPVPFPVHSHPTRRTAVGIENLDISYCAKVTDEGLLSLVYESSGLQSLSATWVKGITAKSIARLPKSCPNLLKLDVSHCDIATNVLRKVRKDLPACVVVVEEVIGRGEVKGE